MSNYPMPQDFRKKIRRIGNKFLAYHTPAIRIPGEFPTFDQALRAAIQYDKEQRELRLQQVKDMYNRNSLVQPIDELPQSKLKTPTLEAPVLAAPELKSPTLTDSTLPTPPAPSNKSRRNTRKKGN